MHPRLLLALALLAVTPGCFFNHTRRNTALDPLAIGRLQPGVSTAKDVVETLGAPTEVVQLGHKSAYRYDHEDSKEAGLFLGVLYLHGVDVQADRSWLFFDEDQTLTHVGTTLEAEHSEYFIPPMEPGD